MRCAEKIPDNCKPNDDQLKKLETLLRESVYGAKFEVDKLPEIDFIELVYWHEVLFKSPQEVIESTITVSRRSPDNVMDDFCVCFSRFRVYPRTNQEATTDPCPRDIQELPM